MKQDQINNLIDCYGLERILEDSEITLAECLDILWELGFLNLDMYDLDVDCYSDNSN